jgi:hypothetical protein
MNIKKIIMNLFNRPDPNPVVPPSSTPILKPPPLPRRGKKRTIEAVLKEAEETTCLQRETNQILGELVSEMRQGVTDLKHLGQKVKKHVTSQKHLFYSVEFGILGNTDLRNQLSGVYRLEIQKHNEKVKQNRYILTKKIC